MYPHLFFRRIHLHFRYHGLNDFSHIHLSEPGLAPIQPRPVHRELALLLGAVGYRGAVSVEMARTDADTVKRTMAYIAEVFQ